MKRILLLITVLFLVTIACEQSVNPDPSTIGRWQALYCRNEGCPMGYPERIFSGYLYNGSEKECPETQSTLFWFGKGGFFIQYYLKKDTCHVFEFSRTP